MFKKNIISTAIGSALVLISSSALADCAAPSINSFVINQVVQNVPVGAIIQGSSDICNTALSASIEILSSSSPSGPPVLVADVGAISTGMTFNRSVLLDRLAIGTYTANLNIKNAAGETLSTSAKSFTVVPPNVPTIPVLPASVLVSELGGNGWTFNVLGESNCPITNSESVARANRHYNYCLVELNGAAASVNSSGDVILSPASPGTAQTVNWQISKIDADGNKVSLASGSQAVVYIVQDTNFSLSIATDMFAASEYSSGFSPNAVWYALSAATAQAYANMGKRAYWIDFQALPLGFKATEDLINQGGVNISGKAMSIGTSSVTYTPKRVLSDGTVILLDQKSISISSALPAIAVSVPATSDAKRYSDINITPTHSGGVCDTLSGQSGILPPEGQCLFTWINPSSPIAQEGISLKGKPNQTGTLNAPWKVEFLYNQDTLLLKSGTTTITVGEAVSPAVTASSTIFPQATKRSTYTVNTKGCAAGVANTSESAATKALNSNSVACYVDPTFPADFYLENTIVTNDVTGSGVFEFTGVFESAGNKSASFVAKSLLPDSGQLQGEATNTLTTVMSHGYNHNLLAPDKSRGSKSVSVDIESTGLPCQLTTNASATNTLDTPDVDRSCIVSIATPGDWAITPTAAAGLMPADGNVSLPWNITLPLSVNGVLHNIPLSQGNKTIVNYSLANPTIKFAGAKVFGSTLGSNLNGLLGNISIDTATANLPLTISVFDANNVSLATITGVTAKYPTPLIVNSLGSKPLFESSVIKIRAGYTGADSDVFVENTYTVVRVPEVTPSVKMTSPKRVKSGTNAEIVIQLGEKSNTGYTNQSSRIGSWKVRLAKINTDKTLSNVTDYQNVTSMDGNLALSVPANSDWLDAQLVAQATLITDVAEFSKTIQTPPVRVLEYIWPTFDFDLRQAVQFAPSDARLLVVSSDKRFYNQSIDSSNKVTYTWNLPVGVTAKKIEGSAAYLNLPLSGTYTISVTIADQIGNTSTITKQIQVAEPVPYALDLKMYSVNKWPTRAPAAFSLRPEVTGGHPLDKILGYEVKVNGEETYSGLAKPRMIGFYSAGEQNLQLNIMSKMGATATFNKTLTLSPNQSPTCTLSQRVSKNVGSVSALCQDVDGKIVAYRWTIDGVEKTVSRNNYSFAIAPNGSSVEMTAIDDAGAETTLTTTVSL